MVGPGDPPHLGPPHLDLCNVIAIWVTFQHAMAVDRRRHNFYVQLSRGGLSGGRGRFGQEKPQRVRGGALLVECERSQTGQLVNYRLELVQPVTGHAVYAIVLEPLPQLPLLNGAPIHATYPDYTGEANQSAREPKLNERRALELTAPPHGHVMHDAAAVRGGGPRAGGRITRAASGHG